MNRLDQIFTEILLALYFTDQTAQEKDAARSLIGAVVDRALQYEPHEVRERLRRKAKSIRPGRHLHLYTVDRVEAKLDFSRHRYEAFFERRRQSALIEMGEPEGDRRSDQTHDRA